MVKKRRKPHRSKIRPAARSGVDRTWGSIIVLDQFREADLGRWAQTSSKLTSFQHKFFSALEAQRRAKYGDLCRALLEASGQPFEFNTWARTIDYEYGDQPLSARGYKFGVGGRFNFGVRLSPQHFPGFPAIYIAETVETGMKERYGISKPHSSGLTAEDFALVSPKSSVTVRLSGKLNNIFDLSRGTSLEEFARIISEFSIPSEVATLAKDLGLKLPSLVHTSAQLMQALMYDNWRAMPEHFSLPSNSQIFGKILLDAGFEGAIFGSTKGNSRCLVVYPQNLLPNSSYISLDPPIPAFVTHARIESLNYRELI